MGGQRGVAGYDFSGPLIHVGLQPITVVGCVIALVQCLKASSFKPHPDSYGTP